ncbi:conserved hypothetical protein [Brucella sp. F5/99]|nr:conserved hypothetical protein [Brucella sp. F5/99]
MTAIAIIAGSQSASPATSDGSFAVRGIGAQPCKVINETAQDKVPDDLVQLSGAWIAGYVSQYNRSTANLYEAMPIVDNQVLGRMAIHLCQSNPDLLFEGIAATLVRLFFRMSLPKNSPVLEISYDKKTTLVRRAVLRLAQDELIKLGYLTDSDADGEYGPLTRFALTKFQQAKGIQQTGLPDSVTLVRLFIPDGQSQPASSK